VNTPRQFERFLAHYEAQGAVGCSPDAVRGLFPLPAAGLTEMLVPYAGASFNRGIYRLHHPSTVPRWNEIVGEAFPEVRRRVHCFAWDWLGRQFALDTARRANGEPLILILEPGSGLVLEVPVPFQAFHNREIVDDPDGVLAVSLFRDWSSATGQAIGPTQCVGFKVPLFLGGTDDLSNFEVTDGEVYWGVVGQIWNQVRHLPPDARIGSVRFS